MAECRETLSHLSRCYTSDILGLKQRDGLPRADGLVRSVVQTEQDKEVNPGNQASLHDTRVSGLKRGKQTDARTSRKP